MEFKHKISWATALILTLCVIACGPSTVQQAATPASEETTPAKMVNYDRVVKAIDEKRTEIESSLGEPMVVSTKELRAKIKQKWEKIHFYTLDGKVVRVKTYPYAQISDRTEEFYFQDQELMLVVIEDDGLGDRGKASEEIDKRYYFQDGALIREIKSEEETEYTIKDSDAEELLAEAGEYLDVYRQNM